MENLDILSRIDMNTVSEESYIISGISYFPEKGLDIAPNIRLSDGKFENFIINFQFKI